MRAELQAGGRCAGSARVTTCARRTIAAVIRWCWCCRRASATRRARCLPRDRARRAPGGSVVASIANDEGAKSGEADLARIAGPLAGALPRTSAACSGPRRWHGPADPALAAQWRDARRAARHRRRPLPQSAGRVRLGSHRSGVRAARRTPAGRPARTRRRPRRGLRLSRRPNCWRAARRITALDLYEAEARALDLARVNLAPFASRVRGRASTGTTSPPACRTATTSSSPIRRSTRRTAPSARTSAARFIAAAAQALEPGGPPVAGREPPPAVRSRARRTLRTKCASSRRSTASRWWRR